MVQKGVEASITSSSLEWDQTTSRFHPDRVFQKAELVEANLFQRKLALVPTHELSPSRIGLIIVVLDSRKKVKPA